MIDLTKDELIEMHEQEGRDFVLINVLDTEAFKQQHIRNSVNVPQHQPQFLQIVNVIAGDKNREIVLYCGSFACDASANAGRKLEDAGFARVYDYKGGGADWFGLPQPEPQQASVPPKHEEWLECVGSEPKPS